MDHEYVTFGYFAGFSTFVAGDTGGSACATDVRNWAASGCRIESGMTDRTLCYPCARFGRNLAPRSMPTPALYLSEGMDSRPRSGRGQAFRGNDGLDRRIDGLGARATPSGCRIESGMTDRTLCYPCARFGRNIAPRSVPTPALSLSEGMDSRSPLSRGHASRE